MGLSAAPDAEALQSAPIPNYDEQLGTTFTQDFSSLAYNVTALAQADANGYGPGYLLNGLTDEGDWYQVGVSYHWPNSDGSYNAGFGFSYEVYGASGRSVYPSKGAGLGMFSGIVDSGDSVLLSLTFTGSTVQMLAKDWNTGATAQASYSSEGSSSFVGDAFAPVDSNGFFTGLMTEWYHDAAYYGNEGKVAYTNTAVALSSAWMWIDEFNGASTAPPIFDNQTQAPVTFADDQVYPFAAYGATMYMTPYEFVTGASATSSTLTLTPAAVSQTAPCPQFSATYTMAGQSESASVKPGFNVLEADPGTMITVTIAYTGPSEYCVFDGTSGNKVTFAAGTNATYVYYLLAEETVSYAVAGGGQALPPSSAPELTYEEPPAAASAAPAAVTAKQVLGTTPATILALVGFNASVTESIPGAPGERWATNTQNETILAANSLPDPIQFYQQYDVSVSYSIIGGGTPVQTPEFNSTAFGAAVVISLIHNATTGWFDAGSGYSFTRFLNGSSPKERWQQTGGGVSTNSSEVNGLAGGDLIGIFAPDEVVYGDYVHQYSTYLGVNDPDGGNVTGTFSGVIDNGSVSGALTEGPGWTDAGLSLDLTAPANNGWQFEAWSGSGAGTYTGTSPSADVTVTGPLSENATFYVQLAIAADTGTNVAYSYGSRTGTVQGGTTKALYVPPSSNVTLRATPSLFVYSFASWKGTGLAKTTKPSLALVVDSPSSVTGTTSFNYPAVLGATIVAAVVIILAASLLVRSRRRKEQIYGFSPSYP